MTEEMNLDNLEGRYVTYEVKYPISEYLEITKTTKVNGVSKGTKKDRSAYAVIDEGRGICLSVQVPASRCEEMDDLMDQFYEAMDSDKEFTETGIMVTGTLERLEGKNLSYFQDFIDYAGFPEEEAYYQITDGMIHGNKMSNVYGLTALGAIAMIVGFFLLFLMLKDPVKKSINSYIEAHPGVTMEQLEDDFASAEKIGGVWMGKIWTFCSSLPETVLANEEIVRVHYGKERSGKYVFSYVYWDMADGSRKKVALSEKQCGQLMEKYKIYPHIKVDSMERH